MELSSTTYRLTLQILLFVFLLFRLGKVVDATTFTLVNNCEKETVWPGILSSAGSPTMEATGFTLSAGASRSFRAPAGKWSGRFWGRTGCTFDAAGHGNCTTGDCGSNQIECNGAGANPPATLVEFTLNGDGGKDFYDVSLVDGYNMPVLVEASGGVGICATTGCAADLNRQCPHELKSKDERGCLSACEAFRKPEYCCSGEYGNPNTCHPSIYSAMFKSACPRSYSYAYDDATSTFTCTSADYTITFCPESTLSRTSRDPSTQKVFLQDDSWLASLVNGGASCKVMKMRIASFNQRGLSIIITTIATISIVLLYL